MHLCGRHRPLWATEASSGHLRPGKPVLEVTNPGTEKCKELLVYSQTEDQKWELEWQRSLPAPILSLCQVLVLLLFDFGEERKKF